MKVKEKVSCDKCGQLFVPRSSRQHFCRKEIVKNCLVCGDEFITYCSNDEKIVCDKPECKRKGKHMCEPVERVCKRCGEKFTTTSILQAYCHREKIKQCPSCGKEMRYVCQKDVNETCGDPQCQVSTIKNKRTQSALELTRVCKWCGKEFHPKDWRDVYCYDKHFKTCVICGKEFEIDPRSNAQTETCSKECMGKLMSQNHDYAKGMETHKKNLIEKYGVENSMQIPGVIEKLKETNLRKYGSEWYTQTEEYKERVKQTNLEKYGSEWYVGSKDALDKRIKTNLEKYGVENVSQLDSTKQKLEQTNLKRYGYKAPSQSPKIKQATAHNNIEKYGVKHPMMLPEFQKKAIDTNLKLYGRKAYTQQHITNIERWYEFIDSPRDYIQKYYDSPPRTKELAADLGVGFDTIDNYLNRSDSFDCVRRAHSLMEEEVAAYIHSTDENIKIIAGSKSIISPYELDLYLPDYNFAIECDPTVTHNSSVPFRNHADQITPPSYHKMKTDMCEDIGINLLHIFGYDWAHKKDVIFSMIRNNIHRPENRIYARKCQIVNVSGPDSIKFLNENHRQGAANSPIRLGLIHEGQLVSLMTFGKMRETIGTGKENLEDCYELVRFCSIINTSVIGGASKLMNHFIKEYCPKQIRSFSDRAHTTGNLYPTLGFKEVRRSQPGYVWVNVADDRAYHRTNAQKQNIARFLKDPNIDLNKTEREIMIEHGFVQVYDSGTITWEWQCS